MSANYQIFERWKSNSESVKPLNVNNECPNPNDAYRVLWWVNKRKGMEMDFWILSIIGNLKELVENIWKRFISKCINWIW